MFVPRRVNKKEGTMCGELKERESELVVRAEVLMNMREEAVKEGRIEDAQTYTEQLSSIERELRKVTRDYGELCSSNKKSRTILSKLDEVLKAGEEQNTRRLLGQADMEE